MVRKLICSKIFSELLQILGYCGKQKDKKYRKKNKTGKTKTKQTPLSHGRKGHLYTNANISSK